MSNDETATGAHVLTRRYFAAVRACDLDGLLALFAADAVMTVPDGRTWTGIAAIRQWFTAVLAAQPKPSCLAEIAGAHGVAAEIETELGDGSTRRTANFFHLDDSGLITVLSSYAR